MRIGGLGYLIKRGWKGMGANRLMTVASVGILTICLIITGAAALLSLNIGRIMDHFGKQNEIRVFILQDTSAERAQQIGQEISALPEVYHCEFVSREDAFTYMTGLLEENNRLLAGYEDVFPVSYKVSVNDLEQTTLMEERLSSIVGVDYARGMPEIAGAMKTIQDAATIGGWALVLALGAVSVIVISNTIKLTVFARRREISIMKYVGATNAFIRFPFFVEGITVGLLSGTIATAVVYGIYFLVYDFFAGGKDIWLMTFTRHIIPLHVLWLPILTAFIAFGAFIGGIGTMSSVRKHLKV